MSNSHLKQYSILAIEDHSLMHLIYQNQFSSYPIKLLIAKTGKEALKIIKNRSQKIDLILLDLGLPDTSPIDLVYKIRKYHIFLPIIIVSAQKSFSRENWAAGSLVQNFYSKPLTGKNIKELLNRHLFATDETPLKISEKRAAYIAFADLLYSNSPLIKSK